MLAPAGLPEGEVASLTWPEVDLEARQLRLTSTKEGYSIRPLAQAAVDLLDDLPRHPVTDWCMLTGVEESQPRRPTTCMKRIAVRAKFNNFTLHTLRHSFATTANTLMLQADHCSDAGAFRAAALLAVRA